MYEANCGISELLDCELIRTKDESVIFKVTRSSASFDPVHTD